MKTPEKKCLIIMGGEVMCARERKGLAGKEGREGRGDTAAWTRDARCTVGGDGFLRTKRQEWLWGSGIERRLITLINARQL